MTFSPRVLSLFDFDSRDDYKNGDVGFAESSRQGSEKDAHAKPSGNYFLLALRIDGLSCLSWPKKRPLQERA